MQHLHIVFSESAPSIYEYPSEQCLLDMLPPEKGDSDFDGVDSTDGEDLGQLSAPLKSTPGIGSEGRFLVIYSSQ